MHYNLNLFIIIETNIFNYVIAKIISQQNINNQLKFMIYFLFKMLLAKCNYEIYNKKLLVIIKVFEE